MADPKSFRVPADLAGARADRVVAQLAGISRAEAKRLVAAGEVTVAGEVPGPADRVAADDEVRVRLPEQTASILPTDIDFGVVYEDATVIVVDKPPQLVVHPGAGHRDDTLANALVARFPELGVLGVEHRWGLVHRLDRETSGLLIVARTSEAHEKLQAALKRRAVGRTYLALVVGTMSSATGTIEAPLGRDPQHPTRITVQQGGRPARTHYRRLAEWASETLLEVKLETGRTHQIRVHLASIGHPVAGDRTYGRPANPVADPGRVWLHAARLSFPHPDADGVLEVEAPLPSDLVNTLRALGPPLRGEVPAV
jgi:23S rRNA pseudouridine1911/1915/1917 synthase